MPDIPTPYKDLTDPGDPRDSLQKLIDAAKSPSHCAPLESEKDPLQLVKDAIDESKKKAGTSWKKIQASLAEEDTAIDPEKKNPKERRLSPMELGEKIIADTLGSDSPLAQLSNSQKGEFSKEELEWLEGDGSGTAEEVESSKEGELTLPTDKEIAALFQDSEVPEFTNTPDDLAKKIRELHKMVGDLGELS